MNVLIAEDNKDTAIQYKIILEGRNHSVVLTGDGEECLKVYYDALKSSKPSENPVFDVVLLDYRMPKRDGIEVAKEILSLNPKQRIIFASAYVKGTLIESVKHLKRAVELLQKPFELHTLIDSIEDKEIYTELERLNSNIEKIDDVDPTDERMTRLLEGLRTHQKSEVWYAINQIVLA